MWQACFHAFRSQLSTSHENMCSLGSKRRENIESEQFIGSLLNNWGHNRRSESGFESESTHFFLNPNPDSPFWILNPNPNLNPAKKPWIRIRIRIRIRTSLLRTPGMKESWEIYNDKSHCTAYWALQLRPDPFWNLLNLLCGPLSPLAGSGDSADCSHQMVSKTSYLFVDFVTIFDVHDNV